MPLSDNKYRLSVDLNAETMAVDVSVIERESDKVVEKESFLAAEIHENVRPKVGLYGHSKLLQDRSSDTPAGPGKLAEMRKVHALLAEGTWERERKAGAPVVSAEVEALAALKSITVAEAQTALRKYSKEQRDKILSNEAIVAKAKEIRATRETTAATLSLDDLAGGSPAPAAG